VVSAVGIYDMLRVGGDAQTARSTQTEFGTVKDPDAVHFKALYAYFAATTT